MAFVAVCESDAPYYGALMAIGVVPLPQDGSAKSLAVRRITSALPLVREASP